MATNHAYDFERFAPQREKPVYQPKLVPPRRKTQAQIKREEKISALQAFKVVVIASALFVAISFGILGRVQLTEKMRKLEVLDANLKTAQSENVRLNMQLNSIASLDLVEEKATTQLGMVKKEKSQIRYVTVGDQDNSSDGVVSE